VFPYKVDYYLALSVRTSRFLPKFSIILYLSKRTETGHSGIGVDKTLNNGGEIISSRLNVLAGTRSIKRNNNQFSAGFVITYRK
jgi:hypothetical protein